VPLGRVGVPTRLEPAPGGGSLHGVFLERLLDNLGLDVEAFATCGVARGWRLRLPAQSLVTLHFILRGEGAIGDGRGNVVTLGTHCLAVVPPGLPHLLQCGTGSLAEGETQTATEHGLTRLRAGPTGDDHLVVACGHIRATWGGAMGVFDQLTEVLVVDLSDTPHMTAVFETLLAEQQRNEPGQVRMMSALMQECLVELFRHLCGRDDCRFPWLDALEDPRIARALGEIVRRPARPHTVGSLARVAAMSRSAFASRFRDVLRRTPMDYVKEVRLRAAARLLERGDLPVEVVAERAGFASRSHFSRAFRARFGRSPTAFRAAGRRT